MSLTQILLAVAALVSLGAVGFGEYRARSAQSDTREAQAALATCNRSVIVQNTRIETWQQAASQAQQEGVRALADAVATSASQAGELKRLRAAKPSSCADAVRIVREGLQ